MACEDVWDPHKVHWVDQEFWVQLLALEHKQVKVVYEQTSVLGKAVQAMDDNSPVLDTILAMAVIIVAAAAWSPTLVLPALPGPGNHPPCSSRPLPGHGRRSCATSSSQKPLPWTPFWVQCHPASPT
ncbi:hypothetical protein Y1Q_0019733 [Alligator mississippiensis]|uniref:Uncharacterized protein n=1 Tax=Alligator mississippiensis TaxID=8496 RepID=A0A151PF70_ALLMI|nr:hypothetical protein Y1Q_0019733 [Alligator mississippiensis]